VRLQSHEPSFYIAPLQFKSEEKFVVIMASEDHPSRASSRVDLEKDALHTGHYSPTEQEQSILDKQLAISEVKASYSMLFRYSTHADLLIMSICSICAIAGGAVLPLITVRPGS
jgi:ATP-binding cassette subfamily B (MDR/TAP) protein 1